MNSIASMLLGLAPVPEVKSKGRVHTADGLPPKAIHKRADRSEEIAARWAAITAICAIEPTTPGEIREATGIKEGTLAEDLRKMLDKGLLRFRMHRAESLYWVPA